MDASTLGTITSLVLAAASSIGLIVYAWRKESPPRGAHRPISHDSAGIDSGG